MGFTFTNARAQSNAQEQANDSWKAQAFLNLWVRKADGTRAKIGAIPLRDSRNFDKALIQRLQEDGAIESLMSAMELDFQMATGRPDGIDVGF